MIGGELVFGACLLFVAGVFLFLCPPARRYVPYFKPLRIVFLSAIGRLSFCNLRQALKSDENVREQKKIQLDLLAATYLLEKRDSLCLYETPCGRFWLPGGTSAAQLCFILAEQERYLYGRKERGVREGDIVLDCGANIGAFARHALKQGAGLVVAIECAPENVVCLRRNLDKEILGGRVVVIEKGVWDRDDCLELQVNSRNSGADSFIMRSVDSHEGPDVEVTTIDKIVFELKLPRVDFLKLDVEAAEERAIRGARETLIRHRPRLSVAVEHFPENAERVWSALCTVAPLYTFECGPCAMAKRHIFPQVIYFHPDVREPQMMPSKVSDAQHA